MRVGLSEVKAVEISGGTTQSQAAAAVSLLFGAGDRPCATSVSGLSESNGRFSVSHDPGKEGEGWLELLVHGLTFDLTGLTPGAPAEMPEQVHTFGLAHDIRADELEAVTLAPGPHIASSRALLPVVRAQAYLAALLAALPGVKAVAWHPARCWSEPGFFSETVMQWAEGGVFPGLGLAALAPAKDGGLQTEGLALFTGQELLLSADLAQDRAAAAKIALRLLHWLVESGPLDHADSLTGPSGETLSLQPDLNHRTVAVSRN